ncbi:MAG: hypothetical protein EZS28_006220 [Streblomastix strix]|uniref:Uncharacterized protein n=1 Tax=Streblomastix strix TaxID=222440 RepID=A0A5J4WV80_9EUKA|nr:MAG: hypothetical protein EZS28_006220 [Streblomastix strix]
MGCSIQNGKADTKNYDGEMTNNMDQILKEMTGRKSKAMDIDNDFKKEKLKKLKKNQKSSPTSGTEDNSNNSFDMNAIERWLLDGDAGSFF